MKTWLNHNHTCMKRVHSTVLYWSLRFQASISWAKYKEPDKDVRIKPIVLLPFIIFKTKKLDYAFGVEITLKAYPPSHHHWHHKNIVVFMRKKCNKKQSSRPIWLRMYLKVITLSFTKLTLSFTVYITLYKTCLTYLKFKYILTIVSEM